MAMGYVPTERLEDDPDSFSIEVLGEKRRARPCLAPPYDPEGARMRAL